MSGYEIHIPGRDLAPAKPNDRPVIRVSAEARRR